jgi:hypothetical protein
MKNKRFSITILLQHKITNINGGIYLNNLTALSGIKCQAAHQTTLDKPHISI